MSSGARALPAPLRLITRHAKALTAVVDQGVSSVTNLGLSLLVARISAPEVFGALGVVSALYLLEVGLIRGSISDPYTVLSAGHEDDRRRDAVAATVRVAGLLSVLHVLAAVLADGSLRTFLLAYAVVTPGLLVQDAARFMLFANGRVSPALVSNLLWALVQAVLSGVAVATDSGPGILLAWGAGGLVSAVWCLRQLDCWPLSHGDWRRWFRDHRQLAVSWSTEHISQQGLFQVLMWTIGIVAGLEAVASYRGALVVVGPATIVIGGLLHVLLHASVRRARAGEGTLAPFAARASVGLGAITLVVLAPLMLLPDSMGEMLLGESWAGTRTVLPWAIGARVLASVVAGLVLGLRAVAEHRMMLKLRLGSGSVTLVAGTAAAAVWGVVTASAVVAAVYLASLPFWWLAFHRQVRSRGVVPAPDSAGTTPPRSELSGASTTAR